MSEYETDILLWSQHQSELLRRLAAGEAVNEEPDWANIIAEITSVGGSDRRELEHQISRVLLHLMKLETSPAPEPRRIWADSIADARRRIERVLADNPSLRRQVPAIIAKELTIDREDAREALARYQEKPLIQIDSLTFSERQVLGQGPKPL